MQQLSIIHYLTIVLVIVFGTEGEAKRKYRLFYITLFQNLIVWLSNAYIIIHFMYIGKNAHTSMKWKLFIKIFIVFSIKFYSLCLLSNWFVVFLLEKKRKRKKKHFKCKFTICMMATKSFMLEIFYKFNILKSFEWVFESGSLCRTVSCVRSDTIK